jgi:flagellar basal-body rod modification protein FlgD
MTTTSSTGSTSAQQTLDQLLQKLGVKSSSSSSSSSSTTAPKTSLDQSDFLKLMTTQMANQDPFQPQDNTQMIAQMAQFSTVTGIQQLNTTMSTMATQIADNQIATVASFAGKTVLVPGTTALADSTGSISGAIDLPNSVTALNVQITDQSGNVVKNLTLGANPAGLVGFSWDGKDANGNPVGKSSYNVSATAMAGGKSTAQTTDVYAPITEVPIPASGQTQNFVVGGVGTVKMSDIKSIKY